MRGRKKRRKKKEGGRRNDGDDEEVQFLFSNSWKNGKTLFLSFPLALFLKVLYQGQMIEETERKKEERKSKR